VSRRSVTKLEQHCAGVLCFVPKWERSAIGRNSSRCVFALLSTRARLVSDDFGFMSKRCRNMKKQRRLWDFPRMCGVPEGERKGIPKLAGETSRENNVGRGLSG